MIGDPLSPRARIPEKRAKMNQENTQTSVPGAGRIPNSKRRPPARSAKILAIGLSTTAMLAMSTGYAFAGMVEKSGQSPEAPTPTPQPGLVPPVVDAPQITPPAPNSIVIPAPLPSPATAAPMPKAVAPAPVVTQETVIEIPTPQAGSGSSNWGKQKSSGSN